MIRLHGWNLDQTEAILLQDELRQRLVLIWDGRPVRTIGGMDVSFLGDHARAAIVVLRYPDLTPLAAVTAETPLTFPYVSGLLAFREGPAVLAAWEKLPQKPDLLMFDGHGIAHPRRFGLASHIGLWLETPAIGVAKSRLYGHHDAVDTHFGAWSALCDEQHSEDVIGAALRTRPGGKPLYVSPGHLIDLEHALAFVLACCRGRRLPEPTRLAHQASKGAHLPVEVGAN